MLHKHVSIQKNNKIHTCRLATHMEDHSYSLCCFCAQISELPGMHITNQKWTSKNATHKLLTYKNDWNANLIGRVTIRGSPPKPQDLLLVHFHLTNDGPQIPDQIHLYPISSQPYSLVIRLLVPENQPSKKQWKELLEKNAPLAISGEVIIN